MVFFIRLFMVLIIFYSMLMKTNANAVKYHHNSLTIEEAKEMVNFTLLTPKEIPNDWTLEIKNCALVNASLYGQLRYKNDRWDS